MGNSIREAGSTSLRLFCKAALTAADAVLVYIDSLDQDLPEISVIFQVCSYAGTLHFKYTFFCFHFDYTFIHLHLNCTFILLQEKLHLTQNSAWIGKQPIILYAVTRQNSLAASNRDINAYLTQMWQTAVAGIKDSSDHCPQLQMFFTVSVAQA